MKVKEKHTHKHILRIIYSCYVLFWWKFFIIKLTVWAGLSSGIFFFFLSEPKIFTYVKKKNAICDLRQTERNLYNENCIQMCGVVLFMHTKGKWKVKENLFSEFILLSHGKDIHKLLVRLMGMRKWGGHICVCVWYMVEGFSGMFNIFFVYISKEKNTQKLIASLDEKQNWVTKLIEL